MSLYERNQMLEEIFAPANRDEDCRRISRMLMPVENAVEQYLPSFSIKCTNKSVSRS